MKKFAISYLACLVFFSISINFLAYQEPNYEETWGPIWVSIIMYVILGSIPVCIGKGIGKLLWLHLLQQAKQLPIKEFTIDSDPYAEAFYLKMGAKRIGDIQSTVFSNRRLPLLCTEMEAI
ncbi:GNAT family N-acetyltransferase [Bacillus paramycoides]|uniref:GNAT family N-acetyltransferase n=1 Tax=Bacillus paramycoides TaxID=2026194 RepID=A0ABU6N271_9BACI|nr:GNAT family N-acetyltransferase [Bacillus paramycoides]MED1569155.1 GNAT family N-acetyltransferase [Bacillus paramycoides]